MKKNIKYLITLCLLLFPLRGYALTGSVSVNCNPSSLNIGGVTTCTVSGNSDASITALEIKTSVNDTIKVSSFKLNGENFFECATEDGTSCDFIDNEISTFPRGMTISGNFVIGTFTITTESSAKVGDTGTLELKDINFYDNNDKAVKISSVTKNISITEASTPTPTVSGLSNITVTNGALSTAFSSNTHNYSVTLNPDVTSFTVNATPLNSSDSVTLYNESVSESNKLSSKTIEFKPTEGKSQMSILVVCGDETYTLNVSKASNDTSRLISTMSVNGVSVNITECKSDSCSGSVSIPIDPFAYRVSVTLSDPDHYKIDESALINGSLSFPDGDDHFAISVIAKDSSTSYNRHETYYITVNRISSGGSKVTPSEPTSNPKTGTASFIVILSLLAISIAASVLIYKRRIVSEEK